MPPETEKGLPYSSVGTAGAYYIERHDLPVGLTYAAGDRKRPVGGQERWTRDPAKLAEQIEQHPDCGLFVALGEAGLWDIDLDVRSAGRWQDTLPALEQELGVALPPTWTIIAPSGGEHRIFRAVSNAPRLPKDLAKFVELKAASGTCPLPPSMHIRGTEYQWKEGHAPWEIELADPPGELIEFAATFNGDHDRAERLADEPIGEGGRRRTLISLAGTLRERGFGEDTIVNQLLAFNSELCDPPLDEAEVEYQARDVAQRYRPGERIPVLTSIGGARAASTNGGSGTRAKLVEYDIARMAREEAPPVPWVVEGFLARQEVTQLWGRPGSMKSLLMMALSGAVAHGEDLAGMECAQGSILYFDAENGAGEVHRRVRNLDLPPEYVHVYGAAGMHLVRDFAEFEAVIVLRRPILVVFDSMRRLLPGTEENDSDAMAEATGCLQLLAKRHEIAVGLIHHGNKAGTMYRGSSAIEAEVTLSFKLAREPNDSDRHRRYLECEKCRVADEPERRWLRLAVEYRRVFVEQTEAPDPEGGEHPAQTELAPQVLALFVATETRLTRPEIAVAVGRTKKDGTVRRVVAALAEDGRLVQDGHRYSRGAKWSDPIGDGTLAPPVRSALIRRFSRPDQPPQRTAGER